MMKLQLYGFRLIKASSRLDLHMIVEVDETSANGVQGGLQDEESLGGQV